MSELDTLVWIDGVDGEYAPPMLRCLAQDDQGLSQVRCPIAAVRRRRAFEPSSEMFRTFQSHSLRFDVELAELRVAGRHASILPEPLAQLRASPHRLFIAAEMTPTLLIPAILLIEALWMWSVRAAQLLMVPGSLDLTVGRPTVDGISHVSNEIVSPDRGATELRRIAWLSQDATARNSWDSVYTYAMQGRLALDMPKARLRGWAWGIELPRGLLVAELDAVVLAFRLPDPDMTLQVGAVNLKVPPAPMPASGLPTFL